MSNKRYTKDDRKQSSHRIEYEDYEYEYELPPPTEHRKSSTRASRTLLSSKSHTSSKPGVVEYGIPQWKSETPNSQLTNFKYSLPNTENSATYSQTSQIFGRDNQIQNKADVKGKRKSTQDDNQLNEAPVFTIYVRLKKATNVPPLNIKAPRVCKKLEKRTGKTVVKYPLAVVRSINNCLLQSNRDRNRFENRPVCLPPVMPVRALPTKCNQPKPTRKEPITPTITVRKILFMPKPKKSLLGRLAEFINPLAKQRDVTRYRLQSTQFKKMTDVDDSDNQSGRRFQTPLIDLTNSEHTSLLTNPIKTTSKLNQQKKQENYSTSIDKSRRASPVFDQLTNLSETSLILPDIVVYKNGQGATKFADNITPANTGTPREQQSLFGDLATPRQSSFGLLKAEKRTGSVINNRRNRMLSDGQFMKDGQDKVFSQSPHIQPEPVKYHELNPNNFQTNLFDKSHRSNSTVSEEQEAAYATIKKTKVLSQHLKINIKQPVRRYSTADYSLPPSLPDKIIDSNEKLDTLVEK